MARKRLIKAPQPVVSSPEEEEEESGSEEEEEEHQSGTVPAPKGTSDEDGSEDDEDDEDDDDDDDEEEKEETEKPNRPLSQPPKPESESVKTKGKIGRKGKRAADMELGGEEDEVNVAAVKKQRTLVDGERNGEVELSVRKRNAVANEEKDGEKGIEDFRKKYPHLLSSLENFPVGMKERVFSRLGMVTEEKLVEMERKCKSSRKVELEVFVRGRDIIDKQTKLCLDAMKSQDT